MDTREILIRIRAEFERAAVEAARKSFNDLLNDLTKGGAGAKNFSSSIDKATNSIIKFGQGLQKTNAGWSGFTNGVRNGIFTLTGFNSIFGRVTLGMLTWQAWRTVANGMREIADATVGANMRMQSAVQMFTALSGGSEEMGQKYISIVRQMAVNTGVSFDELITGAKRLPTQVGQNFEAFANLTEKAVVLGMLDPLQGVEGAFFALTNFMEGTAAGARSLIQRFEMFSRPQVKEALEKAKDPVEALDIIFKEANIDVDEMIEKMSKTLPVALMGVNSMFKELLRVMGEPVIARFTEDIVSIRDFMKDNQGAAQGMAMAFGDGLEQGYVRARNFLSDILGLGDQFDPMQWFDAGVELMVNFTDGILSALTDYVIPGVVRVVDVIAGFFIGASPPPLGPLNKIREGGAETIKQYVIGLVKGLKSEQIEGVASDIIDNIIGIEAQEAAQEKHLKSLEKWVDAASKIVQDKRDELKLFDLKTEDIPERFTRGRRRQLELELLQAQQEERRRKESLNLAREQLEATKEYLKAQRKILSVLQQQQRARAAEEKKAAGEEEAKLVDKSFKDFALDDSKIKEAAERWRKIFGEKLEPLWASLRTNFGDIADFFRGFIGADPDAVRGITEMYEQGQLLSESLQKIKEGFEAAGVVILDILDAASAKWQSLDPDLRKAILGLFVALAAPKLALGAGIILELADPGNVKGILLIIAGLFGTGLGGPFVQLVSKTLQLLVKVSWAAGGVGIGVAKAIFGALTGAGALAAGALTLAVSVLVGLILWKGTDIFKYAFELGAIINILYLKGLDKVKEALGNLGVEVFPNIDFGAAAENVAKVDAKVAEKLEGMRQPWEVLWQDVIPKIIGGSKDDVGKAVEEGYIGPVLAGLEETSVKAVKRSIVPEMMDAIIREYRELSPRLYPILRQLDNLITLSLQSISRKWITAWQMMTKTTITSMMIITRQYANMVQTIHNIETTRNSLDAMNQMRTSAVPTGGASPLPSEFKLNLDANETRKLMEEGTYSAFINMTDSGRIGGR